jgi:hypothetical protein
MTSNGHVDIEGLLNRLKVQREFLEAAQATSARRLNTIQEIRRVVRRADGNSIAKVAEIEQILNQLR